MRTVILFLGVAGLVYLTRGFAQIADGDIFSFLVQKFNFAVVFKAIPTSLWIFAVVLDVLKK